MLDIRSCVAFSLGLMGCGAEPAPVAPPAQVSLTSVEIDSGIALFAKGTTQQLVAVGHFSDGSTRDLTTTSTWSSIDPGVAAVNNDQVTGGVATAIAEGDTQIRAEHGGVRGSLALHVAAAALLSIEVTPAASIPKGAAQQMTAIGVFSDRSKMELTDRVTWTSDDQTLVAVSNDEGGKGLATGMGIGSSLVVATLGTVHGGTSLSVTPEILTTLQLSSLASPMGRGKPQALHATGIYSDGSTWDLTPSATWQSSDPSIVTIVRNSNWSVVAKGMSPGTATVSAILDGQVASTDLSVR